MNRNPVKLKKPGRPPGQVAKRLNIKEAYEWAFEKIGGAAGLAAWAAKSDDNRKSFYSQFSTMLPRNQQVEVAGRLTWAQAIEKLGSGETVVDLDPPPPKRLGRPPKKVAGCTGHDSYDGGVGYEADSDDDDKLS